MCCIFSSRSLGVASFKTAGSPSQCDMPPSRRLGSALFKAVSLQVPASFKMLGLCSCGTPYCGLSGLRSPSVACLCGGPLALRLASTMRGFGASTLPTSTSNSSWEQPIAARAFSRCTPPASSRPSATRSGGFKPAGRCVASCRSGATPSPGFKLRSRVLGGGRTRGEDRKEKVLGGDCHFADGPPFRTLQISLPIIVPFTPNFVYNIQYTILTSSKYYYCVVCTVLWSLSRCATESFRQGASIIWSCAGSHRDICCRVSMLWSPVAHGQE